MYFDEQYIDIAIYIAQQGIGYTFPNPSVGCLIVEYEKDYKNRKIVSFGRTQAGGNPHAESVALDLVNFKKNKKYICYSSLEPCSHEGKSGSCAKKITERPINEVVFSLLDPDIRVNGKGKNFLIDSGIEVRNGILKSKAFNLYAGHYMNKLKKRPKVTLKIAASTDGKIGFLRKKTNITNKKLKQYTFQLRMESDAILIGSNTARVDNPKLDCRIKDLEKYSPIKIIINRDLNLPISLQVLNSDIQKTIIFSSCCDKRKINKYTSVNNKIISLQDSKFNLTNILEILADLGISDLLVEGGSMTSSYFLEEDVVDKLIIYKGNMIIGNHGIDSFNISNVNKKIKYSIKDLFKVDNNHVEEYEFEKFTHFKNQIIERY